MSFKPLIHMLYKTLKPMHMTQRPRHPHEESSQETHCQQHINTRLTCHHWTQLSVAEVEVINECLLGCQVDGRVSAFSS